MIRIIDKIDCCGCQACKQACPANAIMMSEDEEGFWYPDINKSLCIDCGKCDKVCPELKSEISDETSTKIYASYRKDFQKRLKSQSGGLFALLAEKIVEQGGVVFGAAFDKEWNLKHISVDEANRLNILLGSKYVQSEIGNSFQEAENLLKQGKKVLFSGTPCQIQGLKKYLGQEYSDLFTTDLICHGVPSPKVWKAFLNEFSGDESLECFIQKDKLQDNASVYTFSHRGSVVSTYDDNPFTKGFIENLYLRPSCYNCSFKGIQRCSDITLGDFWGLDLFHPEFGDEFGISAVIIHTNKGQKLFDSLHNDLEKIECNADMLVHKNPCVVTSTPLPETRDFFFFNWKKRGVISSIEKILNPKTTQQIGLYFYRIKRRIFRKDNR